MEELTLLPSRLGQISTLIAVFDVIVLGALIVVRLNVPDGWMNEEDLERLTRTARWVMLGNWAIVLFPVIAAGGLIIGAIGWFQPNYAKFFSLLGIVCNGFLTAAWIVGMIGYQILFHSDRFYVK